MCCHLFLQAYRKDENTPNLPGSGKIPWNLGERCPEVGKYDQSGPWPHASCLMQSRPACMTGASFGRLMIVSSEGPPKFGLGC